MSQRNSYSKARGRGGFRGNNREGPYSGRQMNRHNQDYNRGRGGMSSSRMPQSSFRGGGPPPRMVDVACYLTHNRYHQDRDSVMQRATEAGVGVVVVPSLHLKGSISASKLAKQFPGRVYFTAGIHPHIADSYEGEKSLKELEELVQRPECVGIGEIGLDYNRNFSEKNRQKELFEKQLEIACKYNKPLLLHERDAYNDFMAIVVKYQSRLPPVVIHCFTGTRDQALVYVAMGFYIGITGFLIREDEERGVKSLLYGDDIPVDKILVETNGPFMFPQPEKAIFKPGIVERVSPQAQQSWDMCQGGRNEPCALPLIVELVAGCLNRPASEVIEQTAQNAMSFFGLHKFANVNMR